MKKRFDKYESRPDAKNGLQCNPLLGEKFPIKLSPQKTRENKSKAHP